MDKNIPQFTKNGTIRVQAYLPLGVYERLLQVSKKENQSISKTISRLVCENLEPERIMRELIDVRGDMDTIFFALEVLGARMDEFTKLVALRIPNREGLTDEQKKELLLSAQKLSAGMAKKAADTAMAYRTGETILDPLGIDQVLSRFETETEQEEEETD